ncbi:RNA-binding cell elongation regulator Jag/EloR [Streptococcus cuniculipharyngis]|uniref:RNA-binding protein KhpB n=1 Tax=Streptococcus cuniculipharyngis TaxID=1562651 RepID=A0A5C5SAS1_9STRE|nr:RNA-binding cell elongation regulator Jag/EloR [Streptococcus cuniculipharyngis]TWS97657.1 protein jag [Streptococcus cuniculipharyngis]
MVVFTGSTVEEAIDKGLKELKISRIKAHIQVLSREKKGFLGFGKKPAQVDMEPISPVALADHLQATKKDKPDLSQTFGDTKELRKVTSIIKRLEERGELVDKVKEENLSESKIFSKSMLKDALGLDFDKDLVEAEPAPVEELGKSEELSSEVLKPEVVTALELVPDSVAEASVSSGEMLSSETGHLVEEGQEIGQVKIEEAAQEVADYVKQIIYEMDVDASLDVKYDRRQISLQIETPEAGRVIGYHGKVLKSLQLLAQNFLYDRYARHFAVSINVHDYVEHRMETLIEFTQKIAQRVLSSGEDYVMDSMSNQERKIVHKTIAKMDGVVSYSEGSDPNRYVVVTLADQ